MSNSTLSARRAWIGACLFLIGGGADAQVYNWGGPPPSNDYYSLNPTFPQPATPGGTANLGSSATLNVNPGGNHNLDVNVSSAGTLNVIDGIYMNAPNLSNQAGGTANFSAASYLYGYGCGPGCGLGAPATNDFSNSGLAAINGAGVTGQFVNFSNNAGGTLQVAAGGSLNVQSAAFTNQGTLDFGISSTSNGLISLTGNQSLNPTYGSASLAGKFAVELIGGFKPTLGETFEVMSYGSETGAFGNTTFTTGGVTFAATVNKTDIDLTVAGTSSMTAPEIDASGAAAALTLLCGSLMLLHGRLQGARQGAYRQLNSPAANKTSRFKRAQYSR